MQLMKRTFLNSLLILLSLSLALPSLANLPITRVKLKNLKLVTQKEKQLNRSWANFIQSEENSSALKVPNKDYKDDQRASFIVELDDNGRIDLNTMKLDKHTNNFDYNLKIIEFFRKHDFEFTAPKAYENSVIEFIYLAY